MKRCNTQGQGAGVLCHKAGPTAALDACHPPTHTHLPLPKQVSLRRVIQIGQVNALPISIAAETKIKAQHCWNRLATGAIRGLSYNPSLQRQQRKS